MDINSLLQRLEHTKAVIFDMDGVLVDTSSVHESAFHTVLKKIPSYFHYEKYKGMKTEDAFKSFFDDSDFISLLKKEKQQAVNNLLSEVTVFSHVHKLLKLLSLNNIKLGLATSASRERTIKIINEKLNGFKFDTIVTAEDVSKAKPSKDIYVKCLENLNIKPEEALVVEDADNGAVAAKSAGIYVVGVNSQYQESFNLVLKDIKCLYSILGYYFFTFKKNKSDNYKIKERVITVIPAGGKGTRLKSDTQKILYPILNKPILLWLYEKLSPFSEKIILIINQNSKDEVINFIKKENLDIEVRIDYELKGTAPCLIKEVKDIDKNKDILIVWGDQVGIRKSTIEKLISFHQAKNSDLSIPTILKKDPYIHLERMGNGMIERVLKKRLLDDMPEYGENDAGIFLTKSKLIYDKLKELETLNKKIAESTSEGFDFLSYISLLSSQGYNVATISCVTEPETIGVNTVEEAKYHESILSKLDINHKTKILK